MKQVERLPTTKPRRLFGCVLGAAIGLGAGCADLDPAPDPLDEQDEQPLSRDGDELPRTGNPEAVADPWLADAAVPQAWPSDGDLPPSCKPEPSDASVPDADAGATRLICTGRLLGDGKHCISQDDLKLEGHALCAADGLTLGAMKLGDPTCAGGSYEAWISCCEPDVPLPEPAKPVCSGGLIGDGSTCLDFTSIKLKASGACEALESTLVELVTSQDKSCPDGARYAKYQCCTFGPPPAAPSEVWVK
jgi:hypothetical protein